jgi:antitoxin YefM
MTTISLSEAKARLASLLRQVAEVGEPAVITRSGHPAGVLVSLEEYEGLLETLEILADEELRKAVEEGLADFAAGHVVEHEELWDDVEADVRR